MPFGGAARFCSCPHSATSCAPHNAASRVQHHADIPPPAARPAVGKAAAAVYPAPHLPVSQEKARPPPTRGVVETENMPRSSGHGRTMSPGEGAFFLAPYCAQVATSEAAATAQMRNGRGRCITASAMFVQQVIPRRDHVRLPFTACPSRTPRAIPDYAHAIGSVWWCYSTSQECSPSQQ